MTDEATARLALPMLQPGQAQKEMSHNEALARLDLAVQAAAETMASAVPPAAPGPGDCWIVAPGASGDWEGHDGDLAGWSGAGWRFVTPVPGMQVWLRDSACFAVFGADGWRAGEVVGRLIVEGKQVVGPRAEAIPDPAGGDLIDAEARAALTAVLAALRHHGLVDPH